jgi:hypothetical protein
MMMRSAAPPAPPPAAPAPAPAPQAAAPMAALQNKKMQMLIIFGILGFLLLISIIIVLVFALK